jgi:CheY-like chemotaxis protein
LVVASIHGFDKGNFVMMRRIVSAGLPSHVASFLARQLEVSVRITFGGDDTLAEIRGGRCGLVLLDSDLPGLPAESVLRALREDSSFEALRSMYCLAEGDKAAQEASRQRLLRESFLTSGYYRSR